jgi:hypothetical protein
MVNKPQAKEKEILLILIGLIIIWLIITFSLNYLGANLAEHLTFNASFWTASIAILTRKRTEPPYLRITPILGQLYPTTHIELSMQLENLRDSIAKDIEVKCTIAPITQKDVSSTPVYVKNKGIFKHQLAITKSDLPIIILVSSCVDRDVLLSQKFVYEASFFDIYGKKYKQQIEEIPLREQIIEMEKKVKEEKFPSPQTIYPK